MKYTVYYSNLVKSQGPPNLSLKQHQRLLNIVSLESKISEINKWRGHISDHTAKRQAHNRDYKLNSDLYRLTENLAPAKLFEQLLKDYE